MIDQVIQQFIIGGLYIIIFTIITIVTFCCVSFLYSQSLTAALVHHRPEDPAAFLLQCIEHIKSLDGGSDAVFWDTCLDLPNTRSSSRNLSRIRIDLTGLCQGQREDESEESSRATGEVADGASRNHNIGDVFTSSDRRPDMVMCSSVYNSGKRQFL